MTSDAKILDATILKSLQAYRENDLTINILVPLLKKLGWSKVDFSGGVYEGGKDIICWKKDEIDTVVLGVAQVKKYKPTGRAADEKSFSGLVTQLCQAKEMSVANLEEGMNYKPTIVYCITPYEIDIKALQTRFEKIEELKTRQVKVIDGSKLVRLIKTKAPELINKIIGIEDSIDEVIGKELNNGILLNVLNIKDVVDISDFYCDLDLIVGSVNTKVIFTNDFIPVTEKINIDEAEWHELINLEKKCKKYGFGLIKESHIDVISKYERLLSEYEDKKKNHEDCLCFFSNLYLELKMLLEGADTGSSAKKILSEVVSKHLHTLTRPQSQKSAENINNGFEKFLNRIALVFEEMPVKEKNIGIDVTCNEYVEDNEDDIDDLIYEIKNSQIEVKQPKISISVRGEELKNYINELKTSIRESIEKINKQKAEQEEIYNFLDSCNDQFCLISEILSSNIAKKSIKLKHIKGNKEYPSISIGIDKIIDSRHDLIIYGEAGAGKTTSLQMYAKKFIVSEKKDSFSIYVPLTKLTPFLANIKTEKISGSDSFYAAYSLYLKNEGIDFSASDLRDFLESKKEIVVLADGLDEVIKNNDWIIKSLFSLNDENKNVQLIITSRPYERQSFGRSFCKISLLPFDDDKQIKFIGNWLTSRNIPELTATIKAHLDQNPEVKEIARTPLLATILCVLAMNKVPLPQSEVRLYSERLRLLFGDYDVAKGSYRIDSQREDLYLIARKIAYYLHSQQTRSRPKNEIIRALKNNLKNHTLEQIELAVNELTYPCNILIPMTSNNDLGFGHLRYQEHLAATELNMNRGIDIGPLLSSSWWQGSLTLYSKMCDGIDHLFEWVTINSNFTACGSNLNAMINARNEEDKLMLGRLLDSHLHTDDTLYLD